MQFLSSPEIQANWTLNTGYIAARKSSYDTQAMKDYIAKTPQAAVGRDYLKYAQAELATHNNAQVQKFLGDAVQAVFVCGTDFGTQKCELFRPQIFKELYVPAMRNAPFSDDPPAG